MLAAATLLTACACTTPLEAQPAVEVCDPAWTEVVYGTTTRTLEIEDSLTIAEVNVPLTLTYASTFGPISNLRISLESPAGTSVLLGGTGYRRAFDCVFADVGRLNTVIVPGSTDKYYDCHGCLMQTPSGGTDLTSLADFAGEGSSGIWQLHVEDLSSAGGILHEWCVTVYDIEPVDDLACDPGDPGAGTLELSWTNGADYDEVRIYERRALVAVATGDFAAGETSSVTVSGLPTPSIAMLRVVGAVDGREGAPHDCELGVLAEPVECAGNTSEPAVVGGLPFVGIMEFTENAVIGDLTAEMNFSNDVIYYVNAVLTSHTGTALVLSDDYLLNLDTVYWDFGILNHAAWSADGIFMQPLGPGSLRDFAGEPTIDDTGNGLFAFIVTTYVGGTVHNYELCVYEAPPALAPVDVTCTSDGSAGTVVVTWTNASDYDTMSVLVDGAVVTTLPGPFASGETGSYTTEQALGSRFSVELQGALAGGAPGARAGCALIVRPAAVRNLEATLGLATNNATITWEMPAPGAEYDSILVYYDQWLVTTIDGAATQYDATVEGGQEVFTVGIQGSVAGVASELATCAAVMLPPADVDLLGTPRTNGTDEVSSSVEAPDVVTVETVEVVLQGTFVRRSTTIELTGPDMTSLLLFERPGGPTTPDDIVIRFADGGYPAEWWQPGYRFTVAPPSPGSFDVFAGTRSEGTWTLVASSDGEPVTIDYWWLRITGCPARPPRDLSCVAEGSGASLSWFNDDAYSELALLRNDVGVATLPGDATGYEDPDLGTGRYDYVLVASREGDDCTVHSNPCRVVIGMTSVCVENRDISREIDPWVAELEFFEPLNIGQVEVVLEALVTDPGHVRSIELTSPFGTTVRLLESRTLTGSIDLIWSDALDARASGAPFDCGGCLMRPNPGSLSDFTGEVADGVWQLSIDDPFDGVIDRACVEMRSDCVLFPPGALACSGENGDAVLDWTNNDIYDSLRIERDDEILADGLPGDGTTFVDVVPPSAAYRYRVFGASTRRGCESGSPPCTLSVETHVECEFAGGVVPAGTSVEFVQAVEGPSDMGDVEVAVDVRSAFVRALHVSIATPSGKTVTLYAGAEPVVSNDGLDCIFSERGILSPVVTYECGDCLIQPAGPGSLADLGGEDPAGDWVLTVGSERFASLRSWCLRLFDTCPMHLQWLRCGSLEGNNLRPILLEWTGTAAGDSVSILRDGSVIGEVDGDVTSFLDEEELPEREHVYELLARAPALDCGERSHPCRVTSIGRFTACSDTAIVLDGKDAALASVDWSHDAWSALTRAGDIADSVFDVEVEFRGRRSPFAGHARVSLYSPGGTSVGLLSGAGGPEEAIDVTFSNAGTATADYACRCLVRPDGPGDLGDFTGESPTGEWTLILEQTSGSFEVEHWCVGVYAPDRHVTFRRGDANDDGVVTPIIDALALLRWGFAGGATPPCLAAADADGNGLSSPLVDGLRLLAWGFTGTASAPPAPGPDECGKDPDRPATGGLLDTTPADACSTSAHSGEGCAP